MIKRMAIMLVLCAAVFGGVFGWIAFGKMMMTKHMAAAGNPPQTVSTVKAAYEEWQPEIKAVGTLRAIKGADLAVEAAGVVDSINFESGEYAEEGKILLHLRDAEDIAKLESLEAAARLAEITLERDQKQLKAQAVSQATVDNDLARLESARAQVKEQKAVIDKKTLRAPFSGQLGIRAVDVGQYLNPGTMVVSLQQLDPIYLDFFLPEQRLPELQPGQKVTAKADAHPDKTFEGEISAINSRVDPGTHNILVRAIFRNPLHLLLPGMFAAATVASGAPQRIITVPQTAITYNPYGNTVYVVGREGVNGNGEPRLVAKQVFVTTGATRGDQIAVLSGLNEGDEVVTAGQIKLRNGSPVIVNNSVQPANEADPKPEDQ